MKATNTILLLYLSLIAGSTFIAVSRSPYSQDNRMNDPDRNFITEAAKGGKMEVEMGNLAKDKAQNRRVKAYAEMMIRDHTKANSELESIRREKSYSLSPDTDKQDSHMSSLKN